MATAVLARSDTERLGKGRHFDNFFFSGMALLILATVFVGFARTYFLAGVFRAPLPSVIIHIHGAVFASWILLLIAQISLVSAGRVDIHRRLGLVGFGLASLMIVMGILAASNSLARGFAPPGSDLDPKTFYAIPIGDMLIFSTLVFLCLPRPLQSLRTQTSYSDCNHRPYGCTHWSAALRCDNRQTPPGQHFLLAFPAAVGGL